MNPRNLKGALSVARFDYHREPLEHFLRWATPKDWVALNLSGRKSFAPSDAPELAATAIGREQLKLMAADSSVSDELLIWLILSWGGIRAQHAQALKDSGLSEVIGVVGQLRRDELSRYDAYNCFKAIRKAGLGKGMGPAFFTKLIFFASRSHDGYIMDSRTVGSLEVLLKEPFIKTYAGSYVSDKNEPEDFEMYCCVIEDLALLWEQTQPSKERTDETPETMEMRLFGDKLWRALVERLSQERLG